MDEKEAALNKLIACVTGASGIIDGRICEHLLFQKQRVQYVGGKRAIKKADRIIALSKFVSDFLTKRWGVSKEKIILAYHGIDAFRNEDGSRPHIIPKDWGRWFLFTAEKTGTGMDKAVMCDIIDIALSAIKTYRESVAN